MSGSPSGERGIVAGAEHEVQDDRDDDRQEQTDQPVGDSASRAFHETRL
jgi:hypothetical protein